MKDLHISFVGDIMPGGVLAYQDRFYTDSIKEYLSGFDLRVATLEVAIGDNISFDEIKMKGRCNIIYSKNESIAKIVELNINIVSLANNHIFDLGFEGFENTIKLLGENKICYCGAGRNIEEARRPVLIEMHGKTIAFLAYCDYDFPTIGYVPIATENSYGINPLNIDSAVADIKKYKEKCDFVVILPHWGVEYNRFPTKKMKDYGKMMIDAGADLIIGSHAHIVQPIIRYKKKQIFYGLGNFLFPDFYMYPPRPIWYPSVVGDNHSMNITYDYPFPIKNPLKRVWREASRVGLMVEVVISKDFNISSRLSILRRDNIVELYTNKKLDRKLSLLSIIVSSPLYNGGTLIGKLMAKVNSLLFLIKK